MSLKQVGSGFLRPLQLCAADLLKELSQLSQKVQGVFAYVVPSRLLCAVRVDRYEGWVGNLYALHLFPSSSPIFFSDSGMPLDKEEVTELFKQGSQTAIVALHEGAVERVKNVWGLREKLKQEYLCKRGDAEKISLEIYKMKSHQSSKRVVDLLDNGYKWQDQIVAAKLKTSLQSICKQIHAESLSWVQVPKS